MYVCMYAEVEFESVWAATMMMMGGQRLRIRELFGLSRLSLALPSNGSAITLQKRGAIMEGW